MIKVPHSDVPSGQSSRFTKRRRSDQLSSIRKRLSLGDCDDQMTDELKVLPREEREALMKAANFTCTVPPEQGLAMKSDLCLPWKKLRIMRRYK